MPDGSQPLKHCKRCGTDKPPAEFNRNRSHPDGLHPYCKLCHRIDSKTWQRGRGKDAHQDAVRRWRTGNGKALAKASDARTRDRYPERVAARNAVNRALKAGTITKPDTCSACGKVGRVQGHHDSYDESHRLLVRWLCSTCHAAWHRANAVAA